MAAERASEFAADPRRFATMHVALDDLTADLIERHTEDGEYEGHKWGEFRTFVEVARSAIDSDVEGKSPYM